MLSKIRTALIQFKVGVNKSANLLKASQFIELAKNKGGELIALPEYFSTPIYTFYNHAENIPDGPSSRILAENAKYHKIYLVGGTIPEEEDGNIYNTCTVWNPEGELIAKYRKIHMCDIEIPGGIKLKESEIVSPGDKMATFHVKDIKVGLGICYDLRFEEMAKLYRLSGCKLLIYPAAFNMTTGALHWELMQRSRANDNQLYVFTISPARGTEGYCCWGHSQVTDPLGNIVVSAGHGEEILLANIDGKMCDEVRQKMPICLHRRPNIYDTVKICDSDI
ncbi:hypothetical protein WA026_005966 [Henosepilachna vigintioctopunctata]|uniref:omega-amidase n=1 Tax=Henosepilachna vigintioctopunctata TaxID=420089 RepID=A0AAW1U735_9CUCU